ncbi:hypothetical protein HK096_001265, partial [Nowakowskiella sp. JEL0078]
MKHQLSNATLKLQNECQMWKEKTRMTEDELSGIRSEYSDLEKQIRVEANATRKRLMTTEAELAATKSVSDKTIDELRRDLKKAQSRVESAKQTESAYSEKESKLERLLNEREEQFQSLEKHCRELQENLQQTSSQLLKTTENHKSQLQEKDSELKKTTKHMEKAMNDMRTMLCELENKSKLELNSKLKENQSLSHEVDQLTSELKKAVEDLNAIRNEAGKSSSELQNQLQALRNQMADVEHDFSIKLQEQCSLTQILSDELELSKQESANINQDLNSSLSREKELDLKIKDCANELKELTHQMSKEKSQHQTQIATLESSANDQRRRIEALQNELYLAAAQLKEEQSIHQDQIGQLQLQLNDVHQAKEAIGLSEQKLHAKLEKQKNESQIVTESLKKKLKESTSELSRSNAEIQRLNKEIHQNADEYHSRVNERDQEISALRTEMFEKISYFESTRARLEELQNAMERGAQKLDQKLQTKIAESEKLESMLKAARLDYEEVVKRYETHISQLQLKHEGNIQSNLKELSALTTQLQSEKENRAKIEAQFGSSSDQQLKLIKSLQDQMKALTNDYQRAKSELEKEADILQKRIETEKNAREDALILMKDKEAQYRNAIHKMNSELGRKQNEFEKKLEEQKKAADSAQREVVARENIIVQYQNTEARLLEDLQEADLKYNNQMEQFKETRNRLESLLAQSKDRSSALETDLSQQIKACHEFEAQAKVEQELASQIQQELNSRVIELEQKLEVSNQSASTLQQDVYKLNTEYTSISDEKDQLKKQLHSYLELNSSLQESEKHLKEENIIRVKQTEELEEYIKQIQKDIEVHIKVQRELRDTTEQLNENIQKQKIKGAQLISQMQSMQKENEANAQSVAKDHEETVKKLQSINKALENDKEALISENQITTQQLQDVRQVYENKIKEMHNDKSEILSRLKKDFQGREEEHSKLRQESENTILTIKKQLEESIRRYNESQNTWKENFSASEERYKNELVAFANQVESLIISRDDFESKVQEMEIHKEKLINDHENEIASQVDKISKERKQFKSEFSQLSQKLNISESNVIEQQNNMKKLKDELEKYQISLRDSNEENSVLREIQDQQNIRAKNLERHIESEARKFEELLATLAKERNVWEGEITEMKETILKNEDLRKELLSRNESISKLLETNVAEKLVLETNFEELKHEHRELVERANKDQLRHQREVAETSKNIFILKNETERQEKQLRTELETWKNSAENFTQQLSQTIERERRANQRGDELAATISRQKKSIEDHTSDKSHLTEQLKILSDEIIQYKEQYNQELEKLNLKVEAKQDIETSLKQRNLDLEEMLRRRDIEFNEVIERTRSLELRHANETSGRAMLLQSQDEKISKIKVENEKLILKIKQLETSSNTMIKELTESLQSKEETLKLKEQILSKVSEYPEEIK